MDLLQHAIAASQNKRSRESTDDASSSYKKFKPRNVAEQQLRQKLIAAVNNISTPTVEAAPPVSSKAPLRLAESASSSITLQPINDFEVRKRLRTYAQPIALFAETVYDRWERLKEFELRRAERTSASSTERSNVFAEILNGEVQVDLNTMLLKEIQAAKVKRAQHTSDAGDGDDTSATRRSSKNDYRGILLQRSDVNSDEEYVIYFIKRMLAEWEDELQQRPNDVKRTLAGRTASATHKQTRSYLKPLIQLLKARAADADILRHCINIVSRCLAAEYSAATEAYMQLAIGNAAWPMGVTMVGIHERSGREKIASENVAHVLNDETQRKYIQSIKRIITFCQTQYPTKQSHQTSVKLVEDCYYDDDDDDNDDDADAGVGDDGHDKSRNNDHQHDNKQNNSVK